LAKKDVTSISITPQVLEEFIDLVAAKHPDGDKTVSSHVETIMKREITKLKDSNAPDVVDVDSLYRQLLDRKKQIVDLVKDLQKRPAVGEAFNQLGKDYRINSTFANVEAAIGKILQDRSVEGTSAHEFLRKHGASDLTLFIRQTELRAERARITAELLQAQEGKYLNAKGKPTDSEVPEQQQKAEAPACEEELSVEEEPEEDEDDEDPYEDEDEDEGDQGVMLDDSITVVRQTQTSLIPEDQIPDVADDFLPYPEDFEEEGLEPEEEAEDEE